MKKIVSLVAITSTAMAGNAEAHVGQGLHLGFAQGFVHPLGGLDHVLAMFAVGLFASLMTGKARCSCGGLASETRRVENKLDGACRKQIGGRVL